MLHLSTLCYAYFELVSRKFTGKTVFMSAGCERHKPKAGRSVSVIYICYEVMSELMVGASRRRTDSWPISTAASCVLFRCVVVLHLLPSW